MLSAPFVWAAVLWVDWAVAVLRENNGAAAATALATRAVRREIKLSLSPASFDFIMPPSSGANAKFENP
jgi:hypothetical protein